MEGSLVQFCWGRDTEKGTLSALLSTAVGEVPGEKTGALGGVGGRAGVKADLGGKGVRERAAEKAAIRHTPPISNRQVRPTPCSQARSEAQTDAHGTNDTTYTTVRL